MKHFMFLIILLTLGTTSAYANSCSYPVRTLESLKNFQAYAGPLPDNLRPTLASLTQQTEDDLAFTETYRASFTQEERTTFFVKAEAAVAYRVESLRHLAEAATVSGLPPSAVAWLTNHAEALGTCGISAQRKENGTRLASLVAEASAFPDDAIVASLMHSLPQACNDTLLSTAPNYADMPDSGTPAAYRACANLLVKTSARDNPDHFRVHHTLADPACELATRLKALRNGAARVPATTNL